MWDIPTYKSSQAFAFSTWVSKFLPEKFPGGKFGKTIRSGYMAHNETPTTRKEIVMKSYQAVIYIDQPLSTKTKEDFEFCEVRGVDVRRLGKDHTKVPYRTAVIISTAVSLLVKHPNVLDAPGLWLVGIKLGLKPKTFAERLYME